MKPPESAVRTVGRGPGLVLVHGTGTDGESWSPLLPRLQDRARVTVVHRRGTRAWPVGDGPGPATAQDHAEDLARVVEGLGAEPVHLCGASFGAVVVLELARARPDLVRGAVLFEPALQDDDGAPVVPAALLAQFDEHLRRGRPEQAAEGFHRRVLTDAAWERLPAEARRRALAMGEAIRFDLVAAAAYRVRYGELGRVDVPVLLLRGGRSRPAFEAALRALQAALPRARLGVVEHAAHQLAGRAWLELAGHLTAFMGV